MTKPLKFNHKSLFGLAQRTKRALAALLIPAHLPQFFFCTLREGVARARPWGLGALGLKAGSELPTCILSPQVPALA